MSDLLQRGVAWLADQVISKVSRSVEYKQGDNSPVPLNATVGRTLFKVTEDGVSKVVWTDRDYLFKFEDMSEAGIHEPQHGDRIIETVRAGFTTLRSTYLVSAPDGSQPYRNSDGRSLLIRVHTKHFAEEQLT